MSKFRGLKLILEGREISFDAVAGAYGFQWFLCQFGSNVLPFFIVQQSSWNVSKKNLLEFR